MSAVATLGQLRKRSDRARIHVTSLEADPPFGGRLDDLPGAPDSGLVSWHRKPKPDDDLPGDEDHETSYR